MNVMNIQVFAKLKHANNILISGIGGGFDVFGGIPLAFDLANLKRKVWLSSFNTGGCKTFLKPEEVETANVYPESVLAKYLSGIDLPMYVLPKSGAATCAEYYQKIVDAHGIDAIIAVDGGVDSLMHGDEDGAGTLLEDSISLSALSQVNVPTKILACLGFGTETDEGLCHHHALANIAELMKNKAFLGVSALNPDTNSTQTYQYACEYVWKEGRKSHIHTKVISALHGGFGNANAYEDVDPRLVGVSNTEDYISPLMTLYWFFDLMPVAERNLLVKPFLKTRTSTDALMTYRQMIDVLNVNKKERKAIPY